MTSLEANQTLKALERLICVAELMKLGNPSQRAALRGAARPARRAAPPLILAPETQGAEDRLHRRLARRPADPHRPAGVKTRHS